MASTPEYAAHHIREALKCLGLDTNREGLRDTPRRIAAMWQEFASTKDSPEDSDFKLTTFAAEDTSEMVVQTNIPVASICEHHGAAFFGEATVAYIPNQKIVGLSKLARVVDFYSHRFQNQERITVQVANLLMRRLQCAGVGVVLTCSHTCMSVRGPRAHGAQTTTSALRGAFIEPATRAEFLGFHHSSRQ